MSQPGSQGLSECSRSGTDYLLLGPAARPGGPRAVFLCSEAQAILVRQPRTGSRYVFPRLGDGARPRFSELSLWRKARREADIEDVRLHDLRHTFANHAVMARIPLPVVAHLLGHAHSGMTVRYAHAGDAEAEKPAKRIGIRIADLLDDAFQSGDDFGGESD